MTMISVRGLSMTYRAPVRPPGLRAAFASLFHREYREIRAVRDISFDLDPGEVVGFIGPNGAGKTTTMKILSGILHPTAGDVCVLGHVPWQRRPGFLKQIALIRGSQPIGGPVELTVLDSLRYQQLLYEVPERGFQENLTELASLLELEPLLTRQVRALSLGERMRAGLALSLVYRPRVLFMDEPTLGLDVTAATAVRGFIAGYAARTGATVLLTSHYMADVESLCRRIVLIDEGTLRYDGDLGALSARLSPYKLVRISAAAGAGGSWDEIERMGDVVESGQGRVALRVPRGEVPAVTARLLAELPIIDLAVEEPPLESVIDRVYRKGVA